MSSTSTEPKPELAKGAEIAGWTIVRQIGSGGFGIVYEVSKDGRLAAMKTEYITKNSSGSLRNEVKQLRLLHFSPHFCRLLLACKSRHEKEHINVMVMTLVGRSLSTLRRHTPKNKFTEDTAFRLGLQCLQALADLHSVGLIHRDVKPSNFAWCPIQRLVYLLDLGFCRRFMDVTADGKAVHRPARKEIHFMGTLKYCSLNVHNRRDQSRRDDLWSWLYMFVEFVTGKLVWDERSEHVQAIQKEKIGSRLCAGCPLQMLIIFDHLRTLSYASKPNYILMQSKIVERMSEKNVREQDPYDWEEGGAHHEYYKYKVAKDSKKKEIERQTYVARPMDDELSWAMDDGMTTMSTDYQTLTTQSGPS